MELFNTQDKESLIDRLMAEDFKRITLSFYNYVNIDNPEEYRDQLYQDWSALGILGRIFVAREGINAQMNVPEQHWQQFLDYMNADQKLSNVPLKIAVEDDGKSFYKLIVRVKKQIVADNLPTNSYNLQNIGKHLSAKEWNEAMEDPNTVIVDMRNHYESEVGRFEGAICPDADTFAAELPMVLDTLKDQKDKKVLLYCTGGIRCEKASAYLKHHGFQDVNQLKGGIIDYAHQVRGEGLPSRFKGKNFVFDERRGEKITEDIISECHQCGAACDNHVNCKNDACHLLFIQCEQCATQFSGCCTPKCQEIASLPIEAQRQIRKGQNNGAGVYKSRLRPKLKEIIGR